jgi:hypothetical protein
MAPYRRLLEGDGDRYQLSRERLQRRVANGSVGIGVAVLPSFQLKVLTQFDTIKDFCYAITCSERIFPFYRRPGYINGHYVVDGALAAPFVYLSDPVNTVTISPWTDSGADITPQQSFRFMQMIRPPTTSGFISQFQQGYCDTDRAQSVLIAKGLERIAVCPSVAQSLHHHVQRIANERVERLSVSPVLSPSAMSMDHP